jgi:threonylcarbamoyladenosine tRNA methylthiotransferase MtaB
LTGSPAQVVSFGCRLNLAESEVIRRHIGGDDRLVVVNTCAVTGEAERQAQQAIRRLHRERPSTRIAVTGCAAQIDPARWAALPGVSRVVGNEAKLRAETWGAAPSAPPPAARHTRGFVQVQQGCDHRCTFCIIPFGRGPNRSVPAAAVIGQVRALVEAGVREVVLTGVDIVSYRPSLGGLMREVLAAVPDLPRLRLSSLDPDGIDPALWVLLAEEPRLMPHLHLSIQAGSDLILKRMLRRHSRSAALAVIAKARALRPGLAIGADMIAGFPTEADALFDESLAFVAEAEIPYLHVFPYSERPGTPAARMPSVPMPLRRERAARLRDAAARNAAAFHANQVGGQVVVLAERGGRGHTEHFAPVRLDAAPGALVRARVVAADADGLLVEAA